MKSTAQSDLDPQAPLPTGPTHVASRSTRTAAPGAWTPTDRWAWACGLPVSGIARAVANCIARHANDKTGMGWPGIGTIVTETGFCRTAVIAAIKELERGGHVAVSRFKVGKKNKANRYQLPPMGGAPHGLVEGGGSASHALGSASDGLGGSALDGPESVSIESVHESVRSSRAREVCKICGNNWPAEYGTTCYECPQPTASQRRDQERERRNQEAGDELERQIREETPKVCTCGDAYRQSYERLCVDCKGEPNAAQRDALREKHGCRGVDDRVGDHRGVGDNPSVPETETRQPPETRGQRPDNSVLPEHAITQDGGEGEDEPPPKADPDALLRFWKEQRTLYGRKRTPLKHRSDRRRLARTVRKELADLAIGGDA